MFNNEPEILIQERGRDRCVLIDIEHYNYLRGCELEVALVNARKEINEGKFTTGVGQHINHVETMQNLSIKWESPQDFRYAVKSFSSAVSTINAYEAYAMLRKNQSSLSNINGRVLSTAEQYYEIAA